MAEMWTRCRAPARAASSAIAFAPFGLDGLESLRAALVQDADQVDHRVGAGDGARDRGAVADVGGDRRHLPDHAGGLQEQGLVRAAHRDPHQPPGARQIGHHIASDEPRSTEHRCQALHGLPRPERSLILARYVASNRLCKRRCRTAKSAVDFERVLDRMRRAARPAIGLPGPGGGIGRRAGFRYLWGNPWRFESSPGHHLKDKRAMVSAAAGGAMRLRALCQTPRLAAG